MAHLQVLCTVLACVTIYFTRSCDGRATYAHKCRECIGLECDLEPEGGCFYGTTKNCTKRTVCRKGPGDWCTDGRFMLDGRDDCGEGLTCRCGQCNGCSLQSLELECFRSSYSDCLNHQK